MTFLRTIVNIGIMNRYVFTATLFFTYRTTPPSTNIIGAGQNVLKFQIFIETARRRTTVLITHMLQKKCAILFDWIDKKVTKRAI